MVHDARNFRYSFYMFKLYILYTNIDVFDN